MSSVAPKWSATYAVRQALKRVPDERLWLAPKPHASAFCSSPRLLYAVFSCVLNCFGHLGTLCATQKIRCQSRRLKQRGMKMDELSLFSGNANRTLATEICQNLSIHDGKAEVFQFSNENIFVKINENVRGH